MTTKFGRVAGTKNGGEELVEAMRAAGFLRVTEAAERLKLSPATVRVWAARKKVASKVISHAKFVSWGDCVRHFGVDSAAMLKIVTASEATKIRGGS